MVENSKVCSKCKEEKTRDDFHQDIHNIDNLHAQCKECRKYCNKYSKKIKLDDKTWMALRKMKDDLHLPMQDFLTAVIMSNDFKMDSKLLKKLDKDTSNNVFMSDEAHSKLKKLKEKYNLNLYVYVAHFFNQDYYKIIEKAVDYLGRDD
jgi:hypothetical protein